MSLGRCEQLGTCRSLVPQPERSRSESIEPGLYGPGRSSAPRTPWTGQRLRRGPEHGRANWDRGSGTSARDSSRLPREQFERAGAQHCGVRLTGGVDVQRRRPRSLNRDRGSTTTASAAGIESGDGPGQRAVSASSEEQDEPHGQRAIDGCSRPGVPGVLPHRSDQRTSLPTSRPRRTPFGYGPAQLPIRNFCA